MSTAWFVVSLVAVIIAVQVAGWFLVRVWFRRRRGVVAKRLTSETESEAIIRSAEPASYRGSTVVGHPTISNDGLIALTPSRLVFRTLTGKAIDIPVADITGAGEATASGRQHLIVQTDRGDVGFRIDDSAAWMRSLASAAG